MRNMVSTILRQHGTGMSLCRAADGSCEQIRGFFQPVRSRGWSNILDEASPLGEVARGQYIYIGPADTDVSEGDRLDVGQKSYYFRRVEPFLYGDAPIYIWGLCVEKGENDTWGSQS